MRTLFAGIAGRYDRANHLLSGGLDVLWRRALVRAVAATQPTTVLDLATGSGDVAFALQRHLGPQVRLQGLDFCAPMLDEARRKATAHQARADARGAVVPDFALGDCLDLPVASDQADALTLAFGLRNLEDRARGLAEMLRVLRPGGWLFVLEFTQPDAWLRPVYYPYLKHVLPKIARVVTRDEQAYQYLAGSIEAFPDRAAISAELRQAGFAEVSARGLSGGIVALHSAQKKKKKAVSQVA